jgi:tetratricopeptide (TPR) repeat protein
MTQTASDVRDNIVKIIDHNENFGGTGFFIRKDYCITCHHSICKMDEIFVQRGTEKYLAQWVEELSNMEKDVAVLKVKESNLKPLECAKEAMPELPVSIWGFSAADLENFPQGAMVKSQLYDVPFVIKWKEDQISQTKKWNKKPTVEVYVYRCSGKLDKGFSGGPVCYSVNSKVVGMFTAKDDNYGYVVPIEIVTENFQQEEKVARPSTTIDIPSTIDKGNEYFNAGCYDKAIECYQMIITDTNYANAWVNKGTVFYYLKKYNKAIECYSEAIKIDTNNLYAWLNKGMVYDTLGRNNEALKCYSEAIKIDPNHHVIWNVRGWTFLDLKKYKKALNCFDKAIELRPQYAYALNNKGYTLYSLGKYKEAVKYIDISLRIDPLNVYAWRNKALVMYNLRRYNDALDNYERALEIDRNFADAQRGKELVVKKIGKNNIKKRLD